jgi:hypothetical protein
MFHFFSNGVHAGGIPLCQEANLMLKKPFGVN